MASNRPGLQFEADFEQGTEVTALGFRHSGNTSTPIIDVNGDKALFFQLDHYASPVPYRTEVQPDDLPEPAFEGNLFARIGGEYWYGMRLYLPADWRAPDHADAVLMQFHSQPDASESWRNPPVSLLVRDGDDGLRHFVLIVRHDPDPISARATLPDTRQIDLGPIDGAIETWTDFVWHIQWNYDGNGYLQLYRNGNLVADVPGGNCFNDGTGPYLKMGLYEYAWESATDTGADSHHLYIDDVRIAAAGGSLATVAPRLFGSAGADTLAGTSGDDVLLGGAGSDTLLPGAGNDVVYGNQDADLLSGDAGADTLYGGQDGDRLLGGAGGDGLYGNLGDDAMDGGSGNDRLFGGQGADSAVGGAGDDQLYGNLGDDTLDGWTGADTLTGGGGADLFRITAPTDGPDLVTDFTHGQDHVAVVSPNFGAPNSGGLPAGALPAANFALDAATGGAPAFVFTTATGTLSFDADGAGPGAAVAIATLNVRTLSADDILVVPGTG